MLRKTPLFVLIAISALLLAACGGGKKEAAAPTARADGGGAAQATATAPSAATGDDIKKLYENFAKVKSFRATMKVEAGGQTQEGSMEVVLPDKMHLKMTVAGQQVEMIMIGTDTYTKVGGSWTKMTVPGMDAAALDIDDLSKDFQEASTSSAAQKGGTDTVNGKRCQIYTITETDGGKTELCIADGLPLRVVIQSSDSKVTMTFSDFNANIEIKAPI